MLAVMAIAALSGWGFVVVKKHDRKVEARAVEKIERKTDALVRKSVAAQRRIEPSAAERGLRQRYCADC
jgi:hypothetical protein